MKTKYLAIGFLLGLFIGVPVGCAIQTGRDERQVFRNACLLDGHSIEDCIRIFS